MILAVNIGNTNTAAGFWRDSAFEQFRVATAEYQNAAQFGRRLATQLEGLHIGRSDISGCIIASVVPGKNRMVSEALAEMTGKLPQLVGQSVQHGLDISRYEGLLGTDRIVCCISALKKYTPPLVVFDLGTATTVNVVDAEGIFGGGAILPGVQLGLNALSRSTAQLPQIEIAADTPLIGRNTGEGLLSGAIYGTVGILEGFAGRIGRELEQDINFVLTGGNAAYILPHCTMNFCHEPNLILEGLIQLYQEQE